MTKFPRIFSGLVEREEAFFALYPTFKNHPRAFDVIDGFILEYSLKSVEGEGGLSRAFGEFHLTESEYPAAAKDFSLTEISSDAIKSRVLVEHFDHLR